MKRGVQNLAGFVGIGVVYFLLGRLGLSLAFANSSASPVWPPTGFALAVCLLLGKKYWPSIFAGAFLVNLVTEQFTASHLSLATSIGASLSIAAGNTMEALLGCFFVERFAAGRASFDRARSIFQFILLAGLVVTAACATVGVMTLAVAGLARWSDFGPIWLTWWMGDLVSNLVIAPLGLVVWSTDRKPVPRQKWIECAVLISLILFMNGIIFGNWLSPSGRHYPISYLDLPLLLWAAFRFGKSGAVLSTGLIAGLAVWSTLHGTGPFVTGDINDSLLLVQLFVGAVALTGLFLAAVVSERRRAEQRLTTQYNISLALAESASLAEAVPRILRGVCENASWDWGGYWKVGGGGRELRCLEVWCREDRPLPDFEAETRAQIFSRGVGLPGRVWESGEAVWLSDVVRDGNFPRAEAAARDGLQSGFCFPIKASGEVVGVLEFFSSRVRPPDEDLLQMVAAAGRQIGAFVERRDVRDRYRRIVETAIEGVWMVDKDYRTVFVNKSMAAMLGYAPEEMLGRSVPEFIFPGDRDSLQEKIVERRRGRMDRYDFRYRRKDGGELWATVSSNPIFDDEGIFVGALAMYSDITERRRGEVEQRAAEDALRRSDAFRGAVLDSALDCIVGMDGQGRVTEFNPAAEKTFGYRRADVVGKKMADLIIPPAWRERHTRGLDQYLQTGKGRVIGRRLELTAMRADGSEFPVELAITRVASEGPPMFTGYLRDITERKRAEEALRDAHERIAQHASDLEGVVAERTLKLQETIQSLESFSYSIAHDLRAPLRGIQGLTTILLEDYGAALDEAGRGYARRVVIGASRMDQLIQDLLSYGRLGHMEIPISPVNAGVALRSAMSGWREEIERKGAEVRIEGTLPTVLANPVILEQVLANLLGNALKFVPKDKAPRVVIRSESRGERVRLWIEDNGIGISPDYHARIFKVFERLNVSDYSGTGIGLAIVQKGLERMGGSSGVESAPGEGSRFWIELAGVAGAATV